MRLVWAVLCSSSSVDRESNHVSLFDIVEEFEAVPAGATPSSSAGGSWALTVRDEDRGRDIAPFRMHFVTLWVRTDESEETSEFRIRMLENGDQELGVTTPVTVNWQGFRRARNIARIQAIPLPPDNVEETEYSFVVEQEDNGEWRTVASVPLVVRRRQPAAQIEPEQT